MTGSPSSKRQHAGLGLTTAQILYRVPDFRNRVQEHLWQDYDLAPDFPALKKFLEFWQNTHAGEMLSVTITHADRPKPSRFTATDHLFLMN